MPTRSARSTRRNTVCSSWYPARSPVSRRPSTCRKRFSFPGAGYHFIAASLPLRDRQPQLDVRVDQTHARRQLTLVFLVFDLPAALLERAQPALLVVVRLCGGLVGSPAAHPVGEARE